MNRRTYARALAPVICAVALLVGTLGAGSAGANSGAGFHFPGVPFAGACQFGADWNPNVTPPVGQAVVLRPGFSGTCQNVWQFKFLCGVYPYSNTYVWKYSSIHSEVIGAQHLTLLFGQAGAASCVPGAYILGMTFVVSTGPFSTTCSNLNGGVYDFFIAARTDGVPCYFS